MLTAPEFLLVDLMFYEYVPDPEGGYGMPRKLNSHCKPLENIEIPVPGGSRQYSLEGIVEHLGTEMVGSVNHYISYIKKENEWYKINDSVVTQTKELTQQPYVSLYKLQ